jgi:hypothetical protein
MPHLEPSYLRYIYDGLIKGSIHPENAAELPEGLIGLYEEAFDERQPVHKRQQLLERFAIWALLKKEVCAQFVAEVLEQPVEEIQDFISTYSAWFNSPESGKYQLYHERLKVYLLQKLSEKEIHTLHEKLIARLEQAIKDQNADEFEWYGLEFLAHQYAVSAMLNGNGSKLLTIAYNQNHWQRQLKISKGYNWTKAGLHFVMSWASKYNDDEVIECGLQLVDLHHQEQNAAPQIVALVAEGDFDSALKRIEQFGGNDKEGLQRKFILYMLCLMELTLLDSKDKPFRKEGIEKLLKHLDEHLPVDHSSLNWRKFFPSYLIFLVICECGKIGINSTTINKFTDYWEITWVQQFGTYSYSEFEVLINIGLESNSYNSSFSILHSIIIQLAKQGEIQVLLDTIQKVSIHGEKALALIFASSELFKKGEKEKSYFTLKESLNIARCISNDSDRINVLLIISAQLFIQGKTEESNIVLREAHNDVLEIPNQSVKSWKLKNTSSELFNQGRIEDSCITIEEALIHARLIPDITERIKVLQAIEAELRYQEKVFEANSVLIETMSIVELLSDKWQKSSLLHDISIEMAKSRKFDKAISTANEISEIFWKARALGKISTELEKKGKSKESDILMSDSLEIASSLTSIIEIAGNFFELLEDNISELLIQGKVENAISVAQKVTEDPHKSRALLAISCMLANAGQFQRAMKLTERITDLKVQSSTLLQLALIQLKKGDEELFNSTINKAISACFSNTEVDDKFEMLWLIASELNKERKAEKSLSVLQRALPNIINMSSLTKNNYLKKIISNLAYQGKHQEVFVALESTLSFAATKIENIENILEEIASEYIVENKIESAWRIARSNQNKNSLLKICAMLAKQGRIEATLTIINDSSDFSFRTEAYLRIVRHYIEHNNMRAAEVYVHEALLSVNQITHEWTKYNYLGRVIEELSVLDNITETLKTIELLPLETFDWLRDLSLQGLIKHLATKGKFEVALSVVPKISNLEQQHLSYLLIALELESNTNLNQNYSLIEEEMILTKRINEAIESTKDIEISARERYLADIAILLVRFNKLTEALNIDSLINNLYEKSRVQSIIATELVQQGKIEEAIVCAEQMNDISLKSMTLRNIGAELGNQCKWQFVEKIALEITQSEKREFWKQIVKMNLGSESFSIYSKLKNDEAKYFYLKGWVLNLNTAYANKEKTIKIVPRLNEDIESLEHILQIQALQELFFENAPQEKIDRFNRALNIQWAIDLKNQMT